MHTVKKLKSSRSPSRGVQGYWFFKLFNSIKEKHEVELARLELEGLFGSVKPVRNFYDILETTPFGGFANDEVRIQDILAHELPYGETQGFFGERDVDGAVVSRLTRRLGYTRELFVVVDSSCALEVGKKGINHQEFTIGNLSLHRFVTNQYYLEKSQYITKLSRNEEEVDANVKTLWAFLSERRLLQRIPASSTMQVGKRLVDYFTTREEPSLYLAHYFHPYKGKFHPKMVRALLNYIYPMDKGKVMDNFAGCGTLLLEATWMGLDSVGVEINPLSALMSNVKCSSLSIPLPELRSRVRKFINDLGLELLAYHDERSSEDLAPEMLTLNKGLIEARLKEIPKQISEMFDNESMVADILVAEQLAGHIEDERIRSFILLAISGAISDSVRRRSGKFKNILEERANDLYLRLYLFHKLNENLGIRLGESKCLVGDTKNLGQFNLASEIDGIVNSPPYSTALDYIRNDLPQLVLLKLANIAELEDNMMGNPNPKVYKKHEKELLEEIESKAPPFESLPKDAKEVIIDLMRNHRALDAFRSYKFFKDMKSTLTEMFHVLKPGAKAVIIIGNNHYKLDGKYREVRNDVILREIATNSQGARFELDKHIMELKKTEEDNVIEDEYEDEMIGRKSFGSESQLVRFEDGLMRRKLEKTRSGNIRYESILILQKPSESTTSIATN